MAEAATESDEELLDRFQQAAFGYFLEQFNPDNGLVADTSRAGSPASIAVVGFALSCYPVGVERGWMARGDAARRTLVALQFFWSSRQSENPVRREGANKIVLQTTNRRIYAAGDVCLKHKFTQTADASARIVAQNALFLGRKRFSALTIPWCTYTQPEIAHSCMTSVERLPMGKLKDS